MASANGYEKESKRLGCRLIVSRTDCGKLLDAALLKLAHRPKRSWRSSDTLRFQKRNATPRKQIRLASQSER
jgi:hypothetical protein